MANQYKMLLDAGIEKNALDNIANDIKKMSKGLKIDVELNIDKSKLSNITDAFNSISKKNKITADTSQIEKDIKGIDSLVQRDLTTTLTSIKRQFADVIDTDGMSSKIKEIEGMILNSTESSKREITTNLRELREIGFQERDIQAEVEKNAEVVIRAQERTTRQVKDMYRQMFDDIARDERAQLDAQMQAQKDARSSAMFDLQGRADLERQLKSYERRFGDVIESSEEFRNSLKKLKTDIGALKFDDDMGLARVKKDMKDVAEEGMSVRKSMQESAKGTNIFSEALSNSGKQIAQYIGMLVSVRTVLNQVRKATRHIVDLDTKITEIGMVTGKTREETAGLAREYNELAKAMKVTTNEVAEGAVTFYRQGLSQEEVMNRLETTTMFAKITNTDFAESAELLTATVNGMNVEIERAADVMIYLGDSTATSGAEVAKGLSKTAGSANAMGIELEKVASWISVISAKTRDAPESIGAGINMILSRMGRLTEKGFDEEDGTKINDVAKALEDVYKGTVNLMDAKGNLRDFSLVLDEVAEGWTELNKKDQIYLANAMAGARRMPLFLNLMDAYTESMDLYHGALESGGTAHEKYDIYLESLQASIDELKASLESLYQTVVESESLKGAIELLTRFIEILDALIERFGLLGTLVGGASVGLGVKFAGLSAKALLAGESIAILGTSLSLTAPQLALIAGLLVGIPTLLGYIGSKLDESKVSVDNMNQSFAESYGKTESLSELITNVEKLEAQMKLGADVSDELEEAQQRLVNTFPEATNKIDEQGNAIFEGTEKAKSYLETLEEMNQLELKTNIVEIENETASIEKQIEARKKQIKSYMDLLEEQTKRHGTTNMFGGIVDNSEQIERTKKQIQDLSKEVSALETEYESLNAGAGEMSAKLDAIGDSFKWKEAQIISAKIAVAENKEQLALYEEQLISLGLTDTEVSMIMSGNIDMVAEMRQYAQKVNGDYILSLNSMSHAEYELAKVTLENEKAKTLQKKQHTEARIEYIKSELRAMQSLAGGKLSTLSVKNTSLSDVADIQGGRIAKKGTFAREELKGLQAEQARVDAQINKINSELAHIEKIKLPSVPSGGAPASPGGGEGKLKKPKKGTKGKKAKEEYKAEFDAYQRINNELEKNNNLLERNSYLQENNTKGSKQQIELMQREQDLLVARQKLTHIKAEQERKEATELAKRLSSVGFKFEGSGDEKMITNLENISGKSKEVEEDYKRFMEIQLQSLPELQKQWWEYNKSIMDIDTSILQEEVESLVEVFNDFEKELKDIEFKIDMSDMKNFDLQMEFSKEKLSNLIGEIRYTEIVLKDLSNKSFKKGTEASKELTNQIDELTDKLRGLKVAEKQLREERKAKWIAEQNRLYSEQEDRLSALGTIQEKLVQIIKKRGEEERKELDKSHKAEMDSLEERHKDRTTKYKDELDEYKKLIQGKIDALKGQWKEEDYQENLESEKQKAVDLQAQIDILALDDSLEARAKLVKLRKQLAEQEEKINKMQQQKERDDIIDSLQDQLKDKEESIKDKEELANNSFDREKERLEAEYELAKEQLERRYANDKVYAEAKEAIIRGTVEVSEGAFLDIETALHRFEDEFGKGMGILGQAIQDDFIDVLEKAKRAMDDLDERGSRMRKKYDDDYDPIETGELDDIDSSGGGSSPNAHRRPPEFRNWSDYDYGQYVENKMAWDSANKQQRESLKIQNMQLRRKYWGVNKMMEDKYSYKDLIAGYDTGGIIPRDGFIMAHEKEIVMNASQQKKLMSLIEGIPTTMNLNKMPDISKPSSSSAGNLTFEFLVQGDLNKDVMPELEEMVKNVVDKIDSDKSHTLLSNGYRLRSI